MVRAVPKIYAGVILSLRIRAENMTVTTGTRYI